MNRIKILLPGPPSAEGSSGALWKSCGQMPWGSVRSLLSQSHGVCFRVFHSSVPSPDPNHAQAMWWQDLYWAHRHRRELWLCGGHGEGFFLGWRQAAHLADSQVRGEQSEEAGGLHTTSAQRSSGIILS